MADPFLSPLDLADLQEMTESAMPDTAKVAAKETVGTGRDRTHTYTDRPGYGAVPVRLEDMTAGTVVTGEALRLAGKLVAVIPLAYSAVAAGDRLTVVDEMGTFELFVVQPLGPTSYSVDRRYEVTR